MAEAQQQGSNKNTAAAEGGQAPDEICAQCRCKIEVGGFEVVTVPMRMSKVDGPIEGSSAHPWEPVTIGGVELPMSLIKKRKADPAPPQDYNTTYGHLFILYTLQSGEKRIYRGGPSWGNKYKDAKNITEYNKANTPKSGEYTTKEETPQGKFAEKTSFWGNIVTHTGLWSGSYEEKTYLQSPRGMVTVVEGRDYCNYGPKFTKLLAEISSLGIDYDTLGPNSNSVVYTLLKRTGLPTVKPGSSTIIDFPGWGTDLLTDARK